MARETRKTALYGVHFKGVFGRNRSVKFKANRDLVERPAGVSEQDFVTQIATNFASDIKPKAGNLRVVVYRDGEISVYSGEHGTADGNTVTYTTYQPYDAQTLYGVTYEDGGYGEPFVASTLRAANEI
jgi:hypothetical protein